MRKFLVVASWGISVLTFLLIVFLAFEISSGIVSNWMVRTVDEKYLIREVTVDRPYKGCTERRAYYRSQMREGEDPSHSPYLVLGPVKCKVVDCEVKETVVIP